MNVFFVVKTGSFSLYILDHFHVQARMLGVIDILLLLSIMCLELHKVSDTEDMSVIFLEDWGKILDSYISAFDVESN